MVDLGGAGGDRRPLAAAAWRLRLHQRVRDRPPVAGLPGPAPLRGHHRGDEGPHGSRYGLLAITFTTRGPSIACEADGSANLVISHLFHGLTVLTGGRYGGHQPSGTEDGRSSGDGATTDVHSRRDRRRHHAATGVGVDGAFRGVAADTSGSVPRARVRIADQGGTRCSRRRTGDTSTSRNTGAVRRT